ncbi:MAG: UDP-glucose/GDP-mannose dehydrogenase family protein [Chitinophagaceae bacterium]
MYLIETLLSEGAHVKAFDPEAMDNVKAIFGDRVQFVDNQYDALDNADALAIVTEWSEFRNPDFEKMKSSLKQPLIFDGRNVYALEKMQELGFHYESMGRKTIA